MAVLRLMFLFVVTVLSFSSIAGEIPIRDQRPIGLVFQKPRPVKFDPTSDECRAWVHAHAECNDNGESEKFAQMLLSSLQFFSFETLEASIKQQLTDLRPTLEPFLKKKGGNDRIVVPFETGKSSSWLIARGSVADIFLKDYKVDFVDSEKDIRTFKPEDYYKIVLFIDDAIYSGNQMQDLVMRKIKKFKPRKIPIHVIVGATTEDGEKMISPYATLAPMNKLGRIRSLDEIFKGQEGPNGMIFSEVTGRFASANAFFEHKVPDDTSIPRFWRTGDVVCKGGNPKYKNKPRPDASAALSLDAVPFRCVPVILPPYKKELDEAFRPSELDCCDGLLDQNTHVYSCGGLTSGRCKTLKQARAKLISKYLPPKKGFRLFKVK